MNLWDAAKVVLRDKCIAYNLLCQKISYLSFYFKKLDKENKLKKERKRKKIIKTKDDNENENGKQRKNNQTKAQFIEDFFKL